MARSYLRYTHIINCKSRKPLLYRVHNSIKCVNSEVIHTTGIPIIFIRNPDPTNRATASPNPRKAARIKAVDTEGRDFLLLPLPVTDEYKM